jgi:hypothetical protein
MRKLLVWIVIPASTAFLTLSVSRAQLGTSAPTGVSPTALTTAQGLVGAGAPRPGPTDPFGGPLAHYVGITEATLPVLDENFGSPLLVLNRACFAEFPGTRACSRPELYQSIPPPAEWPAVVQVSDQYLTGSCLSSDGLSRTCGSGPAPAICCGFK